MRAFSNRQSVEKREVTKLALIEVLISCSCYLAVGMWLGTLEHLAWAVLLAPLTLLRSDASVAGGISLGERAIERYFAPIDRIAQESPEKLEAILGRVPPLIWHTIVSPLVFLCTIPLALTFMVIRVLTTIRFALAAPLWSRVADNWRRQVLCTDLVCVPEVLPKFSEAKHQGFVFERALEEIGERETIPGVLFMIAITALFYLPPVLYRLTLKATSLVYAPLIWVISTTLESKLPLATRLEQLRDKSDIEKTRRWWSGAIVLPVLFGKTLLTLGWIRSETISERLPSAELISIYVIPDGFAPWQIAAGLNALLTFALLYIAGAAGARVQLGVLSSTLVERTINAIGFTRGLLSIYTVCCGWYITMRAGFALPWPELGVRLLPW